MIYNKETNKLYGYKKSSYTENKDFFEKFLFKLKKPFDDYLEITIQNSIFYSLNYLDNHIGFFSVLDNRYLSSFYLPDSLLYLSKDVFDLIIKDFNIEIVLVTSFDETTFCLCMDHLRNIKTHYLYYTQSGLPVRKPEYPFTMFRKAEYRDIENIKRNTNNFIDVHEERIDKEQLYLLEDNKGMFLGLGVIIPHNLQSGVCSFGVFVHEDKRNIYAGRSILLHLLMIAENMKFTVRCACPFSNKTYAKTLVSAGFVNDSRLFVLDII